MTKTGVVLQVEKNKAILMTASGEFIKVKIAAKAPKLGETYTGKIHKENNLFKYAAAVACLLFMFLSGGGAYAYYSPVTTVQVSINPSLELKLNRFNKIIKYSPLNKDGEVLLSHLSIKNVNIDDGLNQIVEEAKKEHFINDNYIKTEKIISINITSGNKDKSLKLSKFQKYMADQKLNLNLNNNGTETKLEHGKAVKEPKKEVPSDNKKDTPSPKGNDSINKDKNNNNNNNNNNNQNKNNDKNSNKGNSGNNNSNNGNNNNKNDNEKKNDLVNSNNSSPNNNANSNNSIDHPSDNPGNHTPDPGKSKKK